MQCFKPGSSNEVICSVCHREQRCAEPNTERDHRKNIHAMGTNERECIKQHKLVIYQACHLLITKLASQTAAQPMIISASCVTAYDHPMPKSDGHSYHRVQQATI